jgi:hypothetical protein
MSVNTVRSRDPGQSKKTDMGHIVFRDKQKRILPNGMTASCPITFVDQKNGEKMDT